MEQRIRLPILMYHQFSLVRADRMTVTRAAFEWQLQWLRSKGYRPLRFSELLAGESLDDGRRRVLLTFDDGYASVAQIAVPLLQRYGFCATCFIPVGLIGADNAWDGGGTALMDAATLRTLPSDCIELGLHSWKHEDYRLKSPAALTQDIQDCLARMAALQLPCVPVLAYPFGRFPTEKQNWADWRAALERAGIRLACRIGGRVSRWPPPEPLLLTRINVRGDEGKWKFRIKLALGRCKPF